MCTAGSSCVPFQAPESIQKDNGKNGNNARMLTLNDLDCKVLRAKDRTSNPSLSATQSGVQRNRATLMRESLKIAAIQ